jgi:hypothetical protein
MIWSATLPWLNHLARALNFCEQLRDEQGTIDNLMRQAILSREQGSV